MNTNGPKTTVIYLCRAQGGSLYWMPDSCATGLGTGAQCLVSRNVGWDNQVAEARKQGTKPKARTRRASSGLQQSTFADIVCSTAGREVSVRL